MARVGSERAHLRDPARVDPREHGVAREGVDAVDEGERGEAPVDAVHAEVLGVVVREVIALLRIRRVSEWGCEEERKVGKADLVERLDVLDVEVGQELLWRRLVMVVSRSHGLHEDWRGRGSR